MKLRILTTSLPLALSIAGCTPVPATSCPEPGAKQQAEASQEAEVVPTEAEATTPEYQTQLSSWNEGPTKKAIVDFVEKVMKEGSPDYVAPPDRVVVIDNDGTLWVESPVYTQLLFALDRLKEMASEHPKWKTKAPFNVALSGDLEKIAKLSIPDLLTIVETSHAGMTSEEFRKIAKAWLAQAEHPTLKRKFTELTFAPMVELVQYLQERDFEVYIVSGGGIEFVRAFSKEVYGIETQNVIGSQLKAEYKDDDGLPKVVHEAKLQFIDDGPGKPVAIDVMIGKRPIMAFGNSDGDYPMLDWTTAGAGPRLGAIVHHTDAEREFAYDKESAVGRLSKGLDDAATKNWLLIDMKHDWKQVFKEAP